MATIDITRNHSLAKDAARTQAEELAKTLEEMRKACGIIVCVCVCVWACVRHPTESV